MKLLLCFFLTTLSFLAYSQAKFLGVSPASSYVCGHTASSISCWGLNSYGQVRELRDFNNIKKVMTVFNYACVLDDLGAYCWGEAPDLSSEMQESSVTQLQVSTDNVCTLNQGKISCTGYMASKPPTHFTQMSDFAMNEKNICAIQGHEVRCWSHSIEEQPYSPIYRDVGELIKVELGEDFGCVLNSEYKLYCWNQPGQIPEVNEKIIDVKLGRKLGCFQTESGLVHCWGRVPDAWPKTPQKAMSFSVGHSSPCLVRDEGIICYGDSYRSLRQPPYIKDFSFLSGAQKTTCFGTLDKISCTGYEKILFTDRKVKNLSYMKTDDETICYVDDEGLHCHNRSMGTMPASFPADFGTIQKMELSTGSYCAINTQGKVACWGYSEYDRQVPKELTKAVDMSANYIRRCAIDISNKVICWGDEIPIPALNGKGLQIVTGFEHTCVLLEGDAVQCWIHKPKPDVEYPILINIPQHLIGIKGMVGGSRFACLYTETDVSCWGDDQDHISTIPKLVGKIKKITAGSDHVCLQDEERVKCWGSNYWGQYQFLQDEP